MSKEMLKLRDYQADAIMAVRKAWASGVRRAAVVLPTGAGKTVCFAHLAAVMHDRGVKTLILAHRDELIEQAANKLRVIAPALRIGIYKAERREVHGRDVIVGSVQSLVREERRAELAQAGVRLVIVDECHHSTATTYLNVLRDLGCYEDDPLRGAYALGVTATLKRSDGLALGEVWEDVVYQRSIREMILAGHLVLPRGVQVKVEGLDLSRVARSRGDYQDGALADEMREALAPKAVARAYAEHAANRQGILFAPTVQMAYEMADALREAGVAARGLDGGTPLEDRRELLAEFARGDVQVLANCMVLTEGFDAPWCSAIVVARPTMSAPLYQQMIGRALRPHPGKRDALILDVVGVTSRHKLVTLADLKGAGSAGVVGCYCANCECEDCRYCDCEECDCRDCGCEDVDDEPENSDGEPPETNFVDGPLAHEVVDLFGASRQAWLRTRKGVWFLSAGDCFVFLTPGSEPGAYSVARCPAKARGGEFLQTDVDLDMAMSWGEQHANADAAGVFTRRKAGWRNHAPSQGQLNIAARLGLPVDGVTRGELSDAISTVFASDRIDPMPCVATVTERGYW